MTTPTHSLKTRHPYSATMLLVSAMMTYALRMYQFNKPAIIVDLCSYFTFLKGNAEPDHKLQHYLDKFSKYLKTLDKQCKSTLMSLSETTQQDPNLIATKKTLTAAIYEIYTPLTIARIIQTLTSHPSAVTFNRGVHHAFQEEVRNIHGDLVQAEIYDAYRAAILLEFYRIAGRKFHHHHHLYTEQQMYHVVRSVELLNFFEMLTDELASQSGLADIH